MSKMFEYLDPKGKDNEPGDRPACDTGLSTHVAFDIVDIFAE